MPDSINRIALLALLAFVCLAGALGYRAASGAILTAREDNPRRIFAEQRTLRGSILDRDGEVIVETTGEPGAYTRSTLHPDAAPITGYYSINYGTSGVEQAFDSTLRGTLGIDPLRADLEALMHIQPIGRDVQVTLDLDVQRVADALLAGRTGAIVVLSVPEGEVLALASHPTFDPNTLDENWDRLRADRASPLLNRATQGEYQPGTALQPLVLAEALQRGIVALYDTPDSPAAPFAVDAQSLTCSAADDVHTLSDAFRSACPAPFADLGAALGSDALWNVVSTWALTRTDTSVLGIGSRPSLTQTIPLTDTQALREFAAGQGRLTVSPLQMATVASTLGSRGVLVSPRIISATESVDGAWQAVDRVVPHRIAPADIVQQVVSAMPQESDVAWHAGTGLSGRSKLHWFVGFTPIDAPRYAVAALIEDAEGRLASEREAVEIGLKLLTALPRSQ
ncbi:MAG TPA: penicillin-binding transpeptidase domain-containing protein [Anaerolineae bacterium]|nr:penicillin-binding transpeptidase domain-containing protein [Anaerolineae bacterium]